jgi:hypothetical protein
MSFTALMPSGVAAFPSPRRFADTFADMASMSSFLLAEAGNKAASTGCISRASPEASPHRFMTSRTPVQRHIIPASDIASVIAADAPSSAAAETSPIFPLIRPKTKARRARAAQIFDIAIGYSVPFSYILVLLNVFLKGI